MPSSLAFCAEKSSSVKDALVPQLGDTFQLLDHIGRLRLRDWLGRDGGRPLLERPGLLARSDMPAHRSGPASIHGGTTPVRAMAGWMSSS